jgi:putative Mg2+ transporter-C (MgtC) family protein
MARWPALKCPKKNSAKEEQTCWGISNSSRDWCWRRRFITVKQRRQMTLLVERGSLTFHSLHDALGTASPRVKQFVMQQSDDAPDYDVVMITLHRVSTTEYAAIRDRLRQLPCVKEFREDDSTS